MSRFLSPVRWRFILLLAFAAGGYFFANLHRVAIPGAVFDRLQSRFGCQASGVAGLGAAFMYVYAFMQPLTGLLLDRYGSGRVLAAGGMVFITGLFCFSCSGRLFTACLSQILCGLGAGSIYLAVVKENMRTFRSHYNITLAVIILIGYAGGMAANAPLLLVIRKLGLSGTLLLNSIIAAGFLAAIWLLLLPGKLQKVHRDRTISPGDFLPVFRRRHNCKLYLFSALNFALFYVLQTVIGKKFLLDFCNMQDMDAGWVFSVTGMIAAFSGMAMAGLSHLLGNRRRVFCRVAGAVCAAVFGLILLLMLLDVRGGAVYAALFMVLSGTASLSCIVIPLLRETNGSDMVGKAVSMLNFSFYLCVAILGNLAGLLLKCFTPTGRNGVEIYGREAWTTLFAVLFAGALVVLFYSFQMRETFGKTVADIDES